MQNGPETPKVVTLDREIVVAADSLLSWLWHRHVSPSVREQEQQEYDRVIAAFRNACEPRKEHLV
jgi:formylmethanofuran dehydrogenase subunit E-like metal-binding protein